MTRSLHLLLAVFFCGILCSKPLQAQTAGVGKISGRITDRKTGETVIGATVKAENTSTAGASDVEGRYVLNALPTGKYTVTVTYLGYQAKSITDVVVDAGKTTPLDITMEESSGGQQLQEVKIVASYRQETVNSLFAQQKNSVSISSGISSDVIRKSPDRSSSDVIKRVSGASIQDNKFVVIRGLSDRYNAAQLNNATLASSEPDRKAFSFDIFPSNLVDRIVINKTASPDLPGDFAGGVVQVFTKDVPDDNFLEVSIGGGYNSISTGKDFLSNQRTAGNYFGFAQNNRQLPGSFPSVQQYREFSPSDRVNATRLVPNNFGQTRSTALPSQNHQITWGARKDLESGAALGSIISLTYRNSQNLVNMERFDWQSETERTLFAKNFNDQQNRFNTTLGGLANFSYKKGNNKFSLKNIYNRVYDELYYLRDGTNINSQQEIGNFRSNDLVQRSSLNSQLEGEHQLNDKQWKLNWNANFALTKREQPDLHTITYTKPLGSETDPLRILDRDSRRFYSNLDEKNYGAGANLTIPLEWKKVKTSVKTGALGLYKDRDFSARIFRYQLGSGGDQFLTLPYNEAFAAQNISLDGFRFDDITNNTDTYKGQSFLGAGYAMMDNKFSDKLRLVWGTRIEYYYQNLDAVDRSGIAVDAKQTYFDLLPSFNLTYGVSDKTNLRFSGSRTVSRPEFRELAPFAFFDFQTTAEVVGTPGLLRSSNYNADLKFEFYPAAGEQITFSTFYKYFENPIELITDPSSNADLRRFLYANAKNATSIGIEAEIRKNLSFIGDADWLRNFTLSANAAYIFSRVDLGDLAGNVDFLSKRPLQGQSPYLINGGFTYNAEKAKLSFTALYNRVGQRINVVGFQGYPNWWDNARDVIDLQVAKRVLKDKMEIKLNVADLLNQQNIVYQNLDSKNAFNPATDRYIFRSSPGSNISLSLSYRFGLGEKKN